MSFLILSLKLFARLAERLHAFRVQVSLYMMLPMFMSPDQLTGLLRDYYEESYRKAGIRYPLNAYAWKLETWEDEIVVRHMSDTGNVLVLGAGLGRESIALAQRGYRVLGIDHNFTGLVIARRSAIEQRAQARFAQADFFALPLRPHQVDYIVLSGVMYSAIPGRHRRHQFLRSLRTNLVEGGKAVISFVVEREPETAPYRFIHRFARMAGMPGTNQAYEIGDRCAHGHFMHWFTRAEDLRSELTSSGASIIELSWTDAYAIITWNEKRRNTAGGPS